MLKACWVCCSLFPYHVKQIESMLPCVCSVINNRIRQNNKFVSEWLLFFDFATAHIQQYVSYKISPTLYQITNHRGHKFPPSLMFLSFKTRIEWTPVLTATASFPSVFSTPAKFKANVQAFWLTRLLWWQKLTWLSIIFFKICRFRTSILLSL